MKVPTSSKQSLSLLLLVCSVGNVIAFTRQSFVSRPLFSVNTKASSQVHHVVRNVKVDVDLVGINGSRLGDNDRISDTNVLIQSNVASNETSYFDSVQSSMPMMEWTKSSSTRTAEVGVAGEKENLFESLLWRGGVAVLCALWASNFAAAKLVMAEPGVDSSLYAVARFGVAALALIPGAIAAAKRGSLDFETAKSAAICGGWVAFGYLGQTLGLLTTTASRSCVICSLHCIFVAIVAEWMRTQKLAQQGIESTFNTIRLAPAVAAVAGVAIVELHGAGGAPTIGDALSFAQPIGFGLGYLQLEEMMKKRPEAGLPVACIKLCVVALASLAFFEVSPALLNSGVADGIAPAVWAPRIPDLSAIFSSPMALGGILYTGLITTALALWAESIIFKRVPATDASIILTTEPLFAAATGAFFLGETFGMSDYVGATLIIGACILAVLIDDDAAEEECSPDAMDEDCVPVRSYPISK